MAGKNTKNKTRAEIQSQIKSVELAIKRRQANIDNQRRRMFDEQRYLARLKDELDTAPE